MNSNLLKSKHSTSIKSGFISIGLIVVFCLACTDSRNSQNVSNSESKPSPKTEQSATKTERSSIVDIPKLMNQSPEVFENTFGKPIETNKSGVLTVVDYEIPGLAKPFQTTAGLTVFFDNNRAVRMNVDLLKQTDNAGEALSQVKIDIKNAKPKSKSVSGDTWENQTFNGIKFKSISAAKLDLDNQNYTTIQAFVE